MWFLLRRMLGLLLMGFILLELFFALRIVLAAFVPMQSTTFERTAIVKMLLDKKRPRWQQEWRGYDNISNYLKRAVVASEDSRFQSHFGVEWQAIAKAWQHNQRQTNKTTKGRVRGGSTITQQLAKNLFLSSERTYMRKGQELFITFVLEGVLSKKKVFELYLNHAEWGYGIYGAEAAANHYFKKSAVNLTPMQAALLTALLPNPQAYGKNIQGAYVRKRARQISAGMPIVDVP